MAATLYAVNKGYMDSIEVKKVLSFEHGLHAYLKDKHPAMLATMEKNGAKWDVKKIDAAKDDEAKQAFKKACQGAEAELDGAIVAFKKTFA
jgi:F-type H+-transporting ATPase subunit alpha